MADTLETIYTKSNDELHQIIRAAQLEYDDDDVKTRLIATVIMNNDGRLHPIDQLYVRQPNFNTYYLNQNVVVVASQYGMNIPRGANVLEVLRLVIGYELIPPDAEDRSDDLVRDVYVEIINNGFGEIYQEQEYGSDVTQVLFYALQFNTSLKFWDLYEEELHDVEIQSLVRGLSHNRGMTSLGLPVMRDVSDFGMEEFSRILTTNDTLQELRLGTFNMNDAIVQHLTNALRQNETLTSLSFDLINISATGTRMLSNYLKQSALKKFTIQRSNFNHESFDNLTRFISGNDILEELYLKDNRGSYNYYNLASMLEFNKKLKYLSLAHNSVTDNVEKLTNALINHPAIETLNFSRNMIGNYGGKALAKLLENNKTLRALDLGDNDIGDEGAIAIFTALQHNTKLTALDLTANNITEEGAKQIMKLVENNHTLSYLTMHNPDIWRISPEIERIVMNKELRKERREAWERSQVGRFTKPAHR